MKMSPASSSKSVLWWFTGGMALMLAVAGGSVLSGFATAVAAQVGIREESIGAIAVGNLFVGFTVALLAGLRDLARLARNGELFLPRRWVVGSLAVFVVAGPFWNLCVVHFQEQISGSDAVRTLFDEVLYVLVLTFLPLLAVGVPLTLKRLHPSLRPTLSPSGTIQTPVLK